MFDLRRAICAVLLVAVAACDTRTAAEVPRALPGEAASRVAAEATTPGSTAPAIPADAPLVVVLGDSIAAGLHLSAEQAFPAVLQRELAAAGSPFRLVNAGVSGDTSAGGLRRIDWILKQEPDVLVVELGGNDGLRGQDLAGVESNLRGIVERAKASGARVVLLGVQIPTSYGADYAGKFSAIYPRIAADLGVDIVPEFLAGVGGVADMNLEDGLHPTAAGHERVAQNVAPVLRRVLASLPAPAGR
jgi:acyl-CoA thioesterase-1